MSFCFLLLEGTFTSFFKDNKSKRSHKTVPVGIKVFLTIFAWWQKDPDLEPHFWLMDPDPGGPKTCGSGGSGSGTILQTIQNLFTTFAFLHLQGFVAGSIFKTEMVRSKKVPFDYFSVYVTFATNANNFLVPKRRSSALISTPWTSSFRRQRRPRAPRRRRRRGRWFAPASPHPSTAVRSTSGRVSRSWFKPVPATVLWSLQHLTLKLLVWTLRWVFMLVERIFFFYGLEIMLLSYSLIS